MYDNAVKAFNKTASNKFLIPLTQDQKKVIGVLKSLSTEPRQLEGGHLKLFTAHYYSISELGAMINFCSEKWLGKILQKLLKYGLVKKQTEERPNCLKRVTCYQLASSEIPKLPYWNELINELKELKEGGSSEG